MVATLSRAEQASRLPPCPARISSGHLVLSCARRSPHPHQRHYYGHASLPLPERRPMTLEEEALAVTEMAAAKLARERAEQGGQR